MLGLGTAFRKAASTPRYLPNDIKISGTHDRASQDAQVSSTYVNDTAATKDMGGCQKGATSAVLMYG